MLPGDEAADMPIPNNFFLSIELSNTIFLILETIVIIVLFISKKLRSDRFCESRVSPIALHKTILGRLAVNEIPITYAPLGLTLKLISFLPTLPVDSAVPASNKIPSSIIALVILETEGGVKPVTFES